ncbi:MAG TPA: M48 family metallopeptidase [bacterium]|nr:M48 family metallopeptidase [bacterium]
MTITWITIIYAVLYAVRQSFEIRLELRNARFMHTHRASIPASLSQEMTLETYQNAIDYNLAGFRYRLVYRLINVPIHWFFIAVGFNWLDHWTRQWDLNTYLTGLMFVGMYGLIAALLEIPFEIYQDFVLEERFGFNRKTVAVFLGDMVKGMLVAVVLGGGFLLAILWVMKTTGSAWWLIASGVVIAFQVLMLWLLPTVILPMFNRLTPLEGELRERIEALARKAGFPTRDVLTMDGSRRSGHANAFFSGLGKIKRIVFYDTLIEKLDTESLLSVLAHEIGHFKLGHVRKKLLIMLAGVFLFFGFLALVKEYPLFYHSLGFANPSDYAALVIISIILQELTFPFRYVFNRLSRRHEYAADAFAVRLTGNLDGLLRALETLHETNLSAPVTHPSYADYHYSHPDLPERSDAIRKLV